MKTIFVFFISLLSLCACVSSGAETKEHTEEETYWANIGIVNHTKNYIYSTTVDGGEGGHARAMSAGVGSMCCVKLPREWHAGLKVEVGWDVPQETKHNYKSKIVEVEKYDKPGTLYLHFFADDTIRVVVTNSVGASPHHPIAPPPGTELRLSQ